MVDDAGDFYLIPCSLVDTRIAELKQLCERFEEVHPLGRFIDIDLNNAQGSNISSGKSKPCFFCHKKPAIECRRLNTHNTVQVRTYMFEKMAGYCRDQRENILVKRISALGLKALLEEISVTPKPGLVDKFRSGSHTDMDFQTFLASSAAISGWFEELVRAGFSFGDDDLTRALPIIRNIGLRMESAMFASTRNINTQKGLIFLMGLALFASGKIYSKSDVFDTESFRSIIRDICRDLVSRELATITGSGTTHGEKVFRQYGFSGARGEVENGFPLVFDFGLPQLMAVAEPGDEEKLKCLMAISSNNNDTNILYRRGPDVLNEFRRLCKNLLENFNASGYTEVAEFCGNEHISPGGSADLLAVTIFVHSIICADQSNDMTLINRLNDF